VNGHRHVDENVTRS